MLEYNPIPSSPPLPFLGAMYYPQVGEEIEDVESILRIHKLNVNMDIAPWVEYEFSKADLGDQRLNKRLGRIVTDLSASPGSSIPEACGSWASSKACYRFISSKRLSPEALLQPHQQRTVERSTEQPVVLALIDITQADFTTHPATVGLGYLSKSKQLGIMIQTALLVTPTHEILGILEQESWVRPIAEYGKKHTRSKRPIAQKQTQHWLQTQQRCFAELQHTTRVVTVADREADFYEFFAADRPANAEVLIRVAHNRRLADQQQKLRQAVESAPEAGRYTVEIGRANARAARRAELSIRFVSLEILRPQRSAASKDPHAPRMPRSVTVQVILAREEAPPPGCRAIEWLLLTSLPVTELSQAITCVEYYSCRWLIERFHFTLKSGCNFEELELESVERLRMALAIFSIVAWQLLHLLYHARAHPDDPAETMLSARELHLLSAREHRGKPLPKTPPTIEQAVRWIAKLGGFLARRHDGDPGLKVLWRGLRRLHQMIETYDLLLASQLVGNT